MAETIQFDPSHFEPIESSGFNPNHFEPIEAGFEPSHFEPATDQPKSLTFPLQQDIGLAEELARPTTEKLPSISVQEELGRIRGQPSNIGEWVRFIGGGVLHPIRQAETAIETTLKELGLAKPEERLVVSPSKAMEQGVTLPTVPKAETLPGQLAAGTVNAVVDLAQFFLTPEGVMSLGLGAVKEPIRRAVLLDYAGQMAINSPQQFAQAYEAYKTGDYQTATRNFIGGSATAAFSGMLAKHGAFGETQGPIAKVEAVAPSTAEALKQQPEILKPSTTGEPNAIRERQTEEVLRDVQAQPAGLKQEVPAEEGAGRIPQKEQSAPISAETVEVVSSISIGPGAASPGEFAQRSAKAGERLQETVTEYPDLPADPVRLSNFGDEYLRILKGGEDVPPVKADYQTFNDFNSGQFAFGFGKLGEKAKAAWETMALGEMEMRESIGRDVRRYVTDLLDGLPKQYQKEGGKLFTEILDGQKMEVIEEKYAGKPEGDRVIAAAREVKTRLEEIRTTIRDIKREQYRKGLNGLEPEMVDDLFSENISEANTAGLDRAGKVDAMVRAEFPDDWGIADGSYLPHLFFGQYKITAKLPGVEESSFVMRATTPAEAKAKIYDLTQKNPEYRNAEFTVEQDTIIPADAVRLGDRKFWQLIKQQQEALSAEGAELSKSEIRNAQAGIIGRKASKQKWFGSLQKREGYAGYEREFKRLMPAYLTGFHRWRVLSRVNNAVQPMIEGVRAEGRRNAANRLDELMDNLWGKPKPSTLKLDALIQRNPILREVVKPLALERWSRNIRSLTAMATLRTPRFAVVNRLQPLQGLYPLVGERIMAQAKLRQHTPEGRKLLDEAGVIYDPAQWAIENAPSSGIKQFLQRLSGETSNQELAFLAMYQHGTERGLAHQEAVNYAKLRGQLFTQFMPLVVDNPKFMEGPITSALFQYKRFPIKQLELTTKLAQDKNVPGLVRMAASFAAIGGLSYYGRQMWANDKDKKAIKDKLTEDYGSKIADGVMYGLPGLLGADLSGSLVLFDEPWGANIYEKIGRQMTGPAVSMSIELSKPFTQQEQRSLTETQKTMDALRRVPSLRPIAELYSLITGDMDTRTPDGRKKFEKTLGDVLSGIGSFRSTSEANQQLALSAIMELKQETDTLKDKYRVAWESGNDEQIEAALKQVQDFNDRWPEVAITMQELRIKDFKNREKTIGERSAGKKFKSLLEP